MKPRHYAAFAIASLFLMNACGTTGQNIKIPSALQEQKKAPITQPSTKQEEMTQEKCLSILKEMENIARQTLAHGGLTPEETKELQGMLLDFRRNKKTLCSGNSVDQRMIIDYFEGITNRFATIYPQ